MYEGRPADPGEREDEGRTREVMTREEWMMIGMLFCACVSLFGDCAVSWFDGKFVWI